MLRLITLIFLTTGLSVAVWCQGALTIKTDSVTTPINTQYVQATFLKKLFLGKNYRKVWATPVTMPVFHLQSTLGGFTIDELGGGMQTKSLHLKDQNDREWMLRTVNKFVKEALPPKLRIPFIINIVQDMVSAAQPYAPLTVATLADATGIIAANPKLYYVPDDPALGKYRSIFAGQVCMLEQRDPTPDNSSTKSTEKVLDKLMEEHDHLVIQRGVLRARLLDMYIADWDRHADQWRWGVKHSGDEKLYYVIPRDRDQAFFNSNGLLVKLATLVGLPHLVGFKKTLHLKKLNNKSWEFDRLFLNELDASDWQTITKTFQEKLTDSVINTAMHQFPPPIYALDGKEIKNKLIVRRERLYKNVMKYYKFISNHVTIPGSNENETFAISNNGTALTITVTGKIKGNNEVLYFRKFDPSITKKITLMGLGGEDTFIVDDTVSSRIKLYIEGGDGADLYDIKGNIRNWITDKADDKNQLLHTSKSSIHIKDK